MNTSHSGFGPLIRSGIFIGIGMEGFLDGIVFHQLLQLHNMMTARIPKDTVVNMEVNMFWDGAFHGFTWIMTLTGLILLWRAVSKHRVPLSTRGYIGSILLGWGLFNFVEGLFNHHILHLHHVVERLGVSAFDYAFLSSGVILMLIGWAIVRSAASDEHLPDSEHLNPATPR